MHKSTEIYHLITLASYEWPWRSCLSEGKAVKLVKIRFKIEVQNLEAIFFKSCSPFFILSCTQFTYINAILPG